MGVGVYEAGEDGETAEVEDGAGGGEVVVGEGMFLTGVDFGDQAGLGGDGEGEVGEEAFGLGVEEGGGVDG